VATLSPDGIVEEFLNRWNSSGLPEKMPEPLLVANGPVVELNLIAVRGPHQGKGHASLALRMLTVLCDENGVTLTLVARPMAPSLGFAPNCPATLSVEQLVNWYVHHGFVDARAPGDDTRTMVRKPKRFASKES
jgi:GNAT superfamily N-acetyltransferase